MTDFSADSISAFMAIGKRYTVDIKLHGLGISATLLQIDEIDLIDFMEKFEASIDDVIRTVNAFFGPTLVKGSKYSPYTVRKDDGMDLLVAKDRHVLSRLEYALNTHSHEYACETYQALAELVHAVNHDFVN